MTAKTFGPDEIRAMVVAFRDALRSHQALINRLNVYPVPDGDTGTNMALTLESVVEELSSAPGDLAATCKAISHGSLMGARGNSGVLLSGIMRGLAVTVSEAGGLDGAGLAVALRAGSDAAYAAVPRPVEGTILTVIREAAEAAEEALGSDAAAVLLVVAQAAKDQAADALARTPDMLAPLKQAGVVDSGGTGLLLLLDAVLHVADGRPLPIPPDDSIGNPDLDSVDGLKGHGDLDGDGHDIGDLRYEVMYILEAPDETISAFKKVWSAVGDSIVVVGGDGLWNCHIHTDDIGAAIEAAVDIGRPSKIRVTDLLEQVEEERWVREGAEAAAGVPEPELEFVPTAVVAVVAGDGLRRIYTSMGAQRVVTGGQTMNPSTQDLLDAIEATNSDAVVILPNNKNIVPVAQKAAEVSAKPVQVIATRAAVEGIAAMVAYDPEADVEANHAAMETGASAVAAGEVTRAVRDTESAIGPIKSGDWIGIAPDGIRAVGSDVAEVVCALLEVMIDAEHEIVTLVEGEGSSTANTRRVTEWMDDSYPDVEVEISTAVNRFTRTCLALSRASEDSDPAPMRSRFAAFAAAFPELTLYRAICEGAANDEEIAALLAAAPPGQKRPVLFLAALHFLVLAKPELPAASWYRTVNPTPPVGDPWPAVRETIWAERAALTELISTRRTQTNEVNRAIWFAILIASAARDLPDVPVSLFELGASAGFLLGIDRYRIDLRSANDQHQTMGRISSTVHCAGEILNAGLPMAALPAIVKRGGLDSNPIDVDDQAAMDWLAACIWADQPHRFERFRAATELMRAEPVSVSQGDMVKDSSVALEAAQSRGTHLIVANSWSLTYLLPSQRPEVELAIASRAEFGPVSWLSAEPPGCVPGIEAPPEIEPGYETVLGLRRWREGLELEPETVGLAHPHGDSVHLL